MAATIDTCEAPDAERLPRLLGALDGGRVIESVTAGYGLCCKIFGVVLECTCFVGVTVRFKLCSVGAVTLDTECAFEEDDGGDDNDDDNDDNDDEDDWIPLKSRSRYSTSSLNSLNSCAMDTLS